jgi:anti-sigma factor RsiW
MQRMDCGEAKKKLIKLTDGLLTAEEEDALHRHFKECPSCARLALAEQLLTQDIEQVRGVSPLHPITINQVREEIATREKNSKNTNLGVRIMRQVSDAVYTRPRLSLAAAALFILLLASILVPVRTEHSVGYEVAFAAPASGLMLNQANAERMLAALDIDDASIEMSDVDSEVEYRIAPLKDSAQVQRLMVVLDSLGGRLRNTVALIKSRNRTIWQLLLNDTRLETESSPGTVHEEKESSTTTINLNRKFKGDFLLWMPVGDQSGDSLRGLLLDRQGGRTNIQIVGEKGGMAPDDCGWHQYLNNSVMHTQTPDGKEETFNLYDIEDVRKLEKMGYNFVTMKWDTPGQIPIPGMGPKLNHIKPNPFKDVAIIEFMIPQAYEVKVQILDQQGHIVCTLLNCMPLAGILQVSWAGQDADGNPVKPGTYLCRFTAGDYVETQQIKLER